MMSGAGVYDAGYDINFLGALNACSLIGVFVAGYASPAFLFTLISFISGIASI